VSKIVELLGTTDEVVEAFFLPKAAMATKLFIDFRGGKAFPRKALAFDLGGAAKANKQMNVIGHDNKVAQVISVAIKMKQTIGNYFCGCWLSQEALAMALIEICHELSRKSCIVLAFAFQISL